MGVRPKSYDDALARASRDVWPGCGDGRCMPCGRIHDFGYSAWDYGLAGRRVWVPQFQCWQNRQRGCPQPKPTPEHDYDERGRCRCCKARRPRPTAI